MLVCTDIAARGATATVVASSRCDSWGRVGESVIGTTNNDQFYWHSTTVTMTSGDIFSGDYCKYLLAQIIFSGDSVDDLDDLTLFFFDQLTF